MTDDTEETIEGVIVDVRGPASDGTYELDIKQADDEVVTVTITSEQYVELLKEVSEEDEEEPPVPPYLLN